MFYKISMVLGFMVFGSGSSSAADKWLDLQENLCTLDRQVVFAEISGHYSYDDLNSQRNKLDELKERSSDFDLLFSTKNGSDEQKQRYEILCKVAGILKHHEDQAEDFLTRIKNNDLVYPDYSKKNYIVKSLNSIKKNLQEKQNLIIDEVSLDKKGNISSEYNYITSGFRVTLLSDLQDESFNSSNNLKNQYLSARRDAQCKFLRSVIFGK